MIEWFKSLPKTILVTLVLAGGVLFIVLSDPPRTVCDARIKAFQEANKGFISVDPKRANREIRFSRLLEICKSTNTIGGCYELFTNLRSMIKSAKLVSSECYGKLASLGEFRGGLTGGLDLMAQIAWGGEPPKTPALRGGWLDAADLNLFCSLKNLYLDIYSQDSWNSFIEPYFQSLPGAAAMGRTETWNRMIFSVNCAAYI